MALIGEEVGVQSVNLGLVRDGGWRGRGTKTTHCAPFVPRSDGQGPETASQDGTPTLMKLPGDVSSLCSVSRRRQPTLFSLSLCSIQLSKLNALWCPTPSENACRLLYSTVYLLSLSTSGALFVHKSFCVGVSDFPDAIVLTVFLLLVIECFCVS